MKAVITAIVLASALMLAGCATSYPTGRLFTNVSLPVTATGASGAAESVGVATCKSYLGMVALGDCSIQAAMENGNITEVHSVNWKVKNILGIIGTYKVIVRGE